MTALYTEKLFNSEEQEQLKETIRRAEALTSGEIRLYVENHCPGNVLDRAAFIFGFLKMHETRERNGVLFYLAVYDHKFAILGDAGINGRVKADFWDEIKNIMQAQFRQKKYFEGMQTGIMMAAEALKTYFPRSSSDVNELSDDIVFGDDK
jgi:uncharacterized membrane protein